MAMTSSQIIRGDGIARNQQFTLAPRSIDEALRFSEMLAKSELVPPDYRGKPANILVAVQMGAEVGLAPLQALQGIAVVNGRPAMFGDALMALVRGSGLCEYVKEEVMEDAHGHPVKAVCTVKRKGEPAQSRVFTMEDAKLAGLTGRSTWKQYPKRMLQMRARSWALRDVFADVLKGIAVAEEASDMPPVDMGPAEVVEPEPEKSTTERVKAKLAQRKAAEQAPQAEAKEQAPQAEAEEQEKSEQDEPQEAAVTLEVVIAAIEAADSLDALDEAVDAARALSGEDKTAARQAYVARRKALKKAEEEQ